MIFFRVKNDNESMKIAWKLSLSSILIAFLSQVCIDFFFKLKIVKISCINILGQILNNHLSINQRSPFKLIPDQEKDKTKCQNYHLRGPLE